MKFVEVKYQPVINVLKEAESVILRSTWLGTADILLHQRLDLDFSLAELQTVFSRLNILAPVFA